MAKVNEILRSEDKPNLTPLIDVVFLLLAYFMVTTTIIKEEADLGITLPVPNPEQTSEAPPTELSVVIGADGIIYLNEEPYDRPNSQELPMFTAALAASKTLADELDEKVLVTIFAEEDSRHQRTVDVLNACARAKIKLISFGLGEEG